MKVRLILSVAVLLSAIAPEQAVPDNGPPEPCGEIARYLTTFANRNPDLAIDTGNLEFLDAAIGSFRFRRDTKGAKIEALNSPQFSSASEAVQSLNEDIADSDLFERMAEHDAGFEYGSVFLFDARAFGSFAALSHVEGTLICSHVLLVKSAADGLRLGPVLDDKGAWTCWKRSFEVIRVGKKAFPAVVERATAFRSMSYHIALFDSDAEVMDVSRPLCTVSIQYAPRFEIREWLTSPDIDKPIADRLRSRLEPLLLDLAAGTFVAPDANDAALSDEFMRNYDRHDLNGNAVVPFSHGGYSELTATYSPIRIDDTDYLLGYGDALFGWRRRDDSAFGLWLKNGNEWVPIVGGYVGKRGSKPTISAPGN